jgi:hypothetical protein
VTRGGLFEEDRDMVLFPNQTVVHPADVAESVKKEFRKDKGLARAGAGDGVDRASWDVVDLASCGSFPASDAPPWTLGYTSQDGSEPGARN